MQGHQTPKDKQSKPYGDGSDVYNYSDKFTPENNVVGKQYTVQKNEPVLKQRRTAKK